MSNSITTDNTEKKRILIESDEDTRTGLKVLAAQKGMTMKELLRELLRAYQSQSNG